MIKMLIVCFLQLNQKTGAIYPLKPKNSTPDNLDLLVLKCIQEVYVWL